MAVGRRNVERLWCQQTADMACDDLAGNILTQTVALDRQHDGTRDHRAKHRCRRQRLKRPVSLARTSRLPQQHHLPGKLRRTRTICIQSKWVAGLQAWRQLKLRKLMNGAAQR